MSSFDRLVDGLVKLNAGTLAQNSLRSSTGAGGKRYGSRSAMKVLVDSIRSETPRPKSPHMNNEEPIELSHYPGAKPPPPGEPLKIERDDFPAPPYPYTDPGKGGMQGLGLGC